MAKIAVIGYGNIGKHIVEVAGPEYDHEVVLIVNSKAIKQPDGNIIATMGPFAKDPAEAAENVARLCDKMGVEFAMLAIPSGSDIAEAHHIIAHAKRGRRVVTAGKGALANRFPDVARYLSMIGHNAACGAGAGFPDFVRRKVHLNKKRPVRIVATMNGTLNYVTTRFGQGAPALSICKQALDQGFAEPPPAGQKLMPLDLIVGEFGDIKRKIALLFNTSLLPLVGKVVSQGDIAITEFTDRDLRLVSADNICLRYMVCIASTEEQLGCFEEVKRFGGAIYQQLGDMWVAAGFLERKGPLAQWVGDDVWNAMRIEQGGDVDLAGGQGAGAVPTVGTMFGDLNAFIAGK